MYRWYVINTYSGHENKVKQNLEHRVQTMAQQSHVRHVVVPTEQVSELKDGQKVQTEKRTMPGYVLVNMEMSDDAWGLVKNTPGVTGFVGSRNKPVALSAPEVDRLLHRETAERPRTRAQFSIGEQVKVISGPLSDFSGEIAEINEAAGIEKGSGEPHINKVGTISIDQVRQIAERKMPDLNANDLEAASKIIAGTA